MAALLQALEHRPLTECSWSRKLNKPVQVVFYCEWIKKIKAPHIYEIRVFENGSVKCFVLLSCLIMKQTSYEIRKNPLQGIKVALYASEPNQNNMTALNVFKFLTLSFIYFFLLLKLSNNL